MAATSFTSTTTAATACICGRISRRRSTVALDLAISSTQVDCDCMLSPAHHIGLAMAFPNSADSSPLLAAAQLLPAFQSDDARESRSLERTTIRRARSTSPFVIHRQSRFVPHRRHSLEQPLHVSEVDPEFLEFCHEYWMMYGSASSYHSDAEPSDNDSDYSSSEEDDEISDYGDEEPVRQYSEDMFDEFLGEVHDGDYNFPDFDHSVRPENPYIHGDFFGTDDLDANDSDTESHTSVITLVTFVEDTAPPASTHPDAGKPGMVVG